MDSDEYTFEMKDAYTPDTLPAGRMGEYVIEIAKMLGNRDTVHFRRLETGSVGFVYRVEHEAAPKVEQRLQEIKRSEAPQDAVDALHAINDMLRDDNGVGYFLRGAPDPTRPRAEIIKFPGKEIPRRIKIGPINKPLESFEGELVRIGGLVPRAQIETPEGVSRYGELTKAMARELAPYLYQALRVTGEARWLRDEDGTWDLKVFHIKSYTILPKETLLESVERLRAIEGSEWKSMEDPIAFIHALREDEELQ